MEREKKKGKEKQVKDKKEKRKINEGTKNKKKHGTIEGKLQVNISWNHYTNKCTFENTNNFRNFETFLENRI